MKNIHVLPTNKPSRLGYIFESEDYHIFTNGENPNDIADNLANYRNIYITSDEEIREGDWFYSTRELIEKARINYLKEEHFGKIILTTDQDLINDGIQAVEEDFLNWFVKNPSCEYVEVIKLAPISPFGTLYQTVINPIIDPQKLGAYQIWQMAHESYSEEEIKEMISGLTMGQIIPKEEPYTDVQQKSLELNKKFAENNDLEKIMSEFDKPKQETLEEVSERLFKSYSNPTALSEGHYDYMMDKDDFKEAVKELFSYQQQTNLHT